MRSLYSLKLSTCSAEKDFERCVAYTYRNIVAYMTSTVNESNSRLFFWCLAYWWFLFCVHLFHLAAVTLKKCKSCVGSNRHDRSRENFFQGRRADKIRWLQRNSLPVSIWSVTHPCFFIGVFLFYNKHFIHCLGYLFRLILIFQLGDTPWSPSLRAAMRLPCYTISQ